MLESIWLLLLTALAIVARKVNGQMKTTQAETMALLQGKAKALTRFFPAVVGVNVGQELELVYEEKNGNRRKYMKVQVLAVRPVTLENYMKGAEATRLLESEGWSHHTSWERNLKELFGQVPSKGLYRLTLKIVEVYEGAKP